MKLFTFSTPGWDKLKYRFLNTIKDDYEITFFKPPMTDNALCGGGKTMWLFRMEVVLKAINENMGNIILVTDLDMQFFGKTQDLVEERMKDVDIAVQIEVDSYDPYVEVINIGFMGIKCSEKTRDFFQEVLNRVNFYNDGRAWEQLQIRELLYQKYADVSWGFFDKRIWAWDKRENSIPADAVLHHAIHVPGLEGKVIQLKKCYAEWEAKQKAKLESETLQ